MGAGDIGHLPEEAIKVYPWHQDGLCRTKEEEGPKEPHRLLERGVNCFLIRAHLSLFMETTFYFKAVFTRQAIIIKQLNNFNRNLIAIT